jgi:choline dehydrogenase
MRAMTENQARNRAQLKAAYDYVVVGAGASGCVVAGELSKTGADVLLIEFEVRLASRCTRERT